MEFCTEISQTFARFLQNGEACAIIQGEQQFQMAPLRRIQQRFAHPGKPLFNRLLVFAGMNPAAITQFETVLRASDEKQAAPLLPYECRL